MKEAGRILHHGMNSDSSFQRIDELVDEEFDQKLEPEVEPESGFGADRSLGDAPRTSPARLIHGKVSRSGRGSARGTRGELRVLVVEDDFTSRVLLQSLLLEFGTVHIAVDGLEAIQAFCEARQSRQPYDLICMDVRMPEMNGMEALERIRMIETQGGVEPSHAVKIFMTTAVRDLKIVSASFNALCDAYLSKPLDATRLIAEMHQHGLMRDPAVVEGA